MIIDNESWSHFLNREDQVLQSEEQLSMLALASKPDLLIWPEATTGEEIFQQRSFNETVHRIVLSFNGYFLVGSQDSEVTGKKVYNTAYFFGPGGDSYQYYQKTKLVLLGEYLPLQSEWLHKILDVGMDMTPGPGPKKFEMEKPAVTFSPMICFEDTLPEVADKAAQLRPDFFVTITNDGWYWGWTAQWGVRQHLAHAVFRCVEHDRPMIRCANNGISCEINQDGTVTGRFRSASGTDVDVGGIFAQKLEFYPAHVTFYEAWGDWIILISSLISGMLGLRFFSRSCVRSSES
jgi:apolipoprotein N-acyltransferase